MKSREEIKEEMVLLWEQYEQNLDIRDKNVIVIGVDLLYDLRILHEEYEKLFEKNDFLQDETHGMALQGKHYT